MAAKDWKLLEADNTSIGDASTGGAISLAPNENPANIDNAIRALRAELAHWRDDQVIWANAEGVVADGVTDDTVAWRAIAAKAAATGRYRICWYGTSIVSDPTSSGACIDFNSKVQLQGFGWYSALQPAASVSSSTKIIRIRPDPVLSDDAGFIKNCLIGNPNAASSAGGARIMLDATSPLAYMAHYLIEGVHCQAGAAGHSIEVVNSVAHRYIPFTNGNATMGGLAAGAVINGQTSGATGTLISAPVAVTGSFAAGNATGALEVTVTSGTWQNAENIRSSTTVIGVTASAGSIMNIQGGVALLTIRKCAIGAGILLTKTGDNIVIDHCSATGSNGFVDADIIAGASHFTVRDCTSVLTGGAPVVIRNSTRVYIKGNNFELDSGSGEDNSLIRIYNTNAEGGGGTIEDNLLAAYGTSNPAYAIRCSNVNNLRIVGNTFATGGHYTPNAVVSNSGPGPINFSRSQTYVNWAASQRVAFDSSAYTSGVRKALTLNAGWNAFATGQELRITKIDGIAYLEGAIKDGSGSPLTIPLGLRPAQRTVVDILSFDSSSARVACYATIETDGVVTITGGNNAQIRFDGITYVIADASNATAPI